jgi:hypothetical protein
MTRRYETFKKQVRRLSPNHIIPTQRDKEMYRRCAVALYEIRQGNYTIYSYDFEWRRLPQKPTAPPPIDIMIDMLPPPPAWL